MPNAYCYDFDGANDQGTASGLSFSPGAGGWSISLWAKAWWLLNNYVDLVMFKFGGMRSLGLSKGQGTSHRRLRVYENGISYQSPTNMPVLADNAWVHIVATSTTNTSGGGQIVIYLDGAVFHTVAAGNGLPTTTSVEIGTQGFLGLMDEVGVYDVALSITEVAEIYSSPGESLDLTMLSSSGNLKHWWRFGDGTGDTATTFVNDERGSADLTMSGFSAPFGRVSGGPPWGGAGGGGGGGGGTSGASVAVADYKVGDSATGLHWDSTTGYLSGVGVGVYTQIASGVIATGSGPTDVLTLAAGKEYLVYVANSDNGGALLVSADVVSGAATVLAVTGSSATIALSTYSLSAAASQSATKTVQLLATGSASEQLTQLSVQDQVLADTTTLTIRQDGDIEATHTNAGGGTNGAWIVLEKN